MLRFIYRQGLLALLVCGCGNHDERDTGDDTGAIAESDAGAGPEAMPSSLEDAAPVDEGPWMRLADRPCPEDNQLSWESFGAAFMLEYCTGCHGRAVASGARQGAPDTVVFDDPNSIRELEERIWARAADNNATMPPVGGPDAETRRKLGQWLACGSPVRAQL